MTDAAIARELGAASAIEEQARHAWQGTTDVAEKDSALIVLRHATALRKSLEGWIGRRAMRAQLVRQ